MICQEFIDFLMDYDDGALPAVARARFDEHLSVCPDCIHYLASYRATKALAKSAFSIGTAHVPPDVPRELTDAIRSAYKHSTD